MALPEERDRADLAAGAELREDPEERGRADLPVLPPLLPALVYPPPHTTRPLVEPEALPCRPTTMIEVPYPPYPYLP